MKTAALALILVSTAAFAQTAPSESVSLASQTEAGVECIPCKEAAARENQLKILQEVMDDSRFPVINGISTKAAIQEVVHEAKIQEDSAKVTTADKVSKQLKKYTVMVDSVGSLDQQTAEELAKILAARGIDNNTVIDFRILKMKADADRAEAMGRFRKALKIVLTPYVNDARQEVKEDYEQLKNRLTKKSDSSVATGGGSSEVDMNKSYNITDSVIENGEYLLENIRLSTGSVSVRVWGSANPETTRSITMTKGKGSKKSLEARYGAIKDSKIQYGLTSQIGTTDQGKRDMGAYFYIGAELNPDFSLAKIK